MFICDYFDFITKDSATFLPQNIELVANVPLLVTNFTWQQTVAQPFAMKIGIGSNDTFTSDHVFPIAKTWVQSFAVDNIYFVANARVFESFRLSKLVKQPFVKEMELVANVSGCTHF